MTGEVFEEVVIPPRSARRETLAVAGAVLAIALACTLRFVLLSRGKGSAAGEAGAGPALSAAEATVFQTLVVAADSAASLRAADGRWPSPARLEAEGIPPFAAALLPKDLRSYRWEEYARPRGVDYAGQDSGGRPRSSFLLRLEEREAAAMGQGSVLLVEVWMHPRRDPRVVEALGVAGWTRLVALEGRAGAEKKP